MLNKVSLIGNLGQDPEIRYTQSGSKIASFSIATTEKWKDRQSGEQKTQTQWHRVVVFNENIANVVEQYVKKGSSVYVEGSLQYRKYTGADEIEKNITEVVISQFKGELKLLGSRNNMMDDHQETSFSNTQKFAAENSSSTKSKVNVNDIGNDLDDEIPF